jgi:hypothetical protein
LFDVLIVHRGFIIVCSPRCIRTCTPIYIYFVLRSACAVPAYVDAEAYREFVNLSLQIVTLDLLRRQSTLVQETLIVRPLVNHPML